MEPCSGVLTGATQAHTQATSTRHSHRCMVDTSKDKGATGKDGEADSSRWGPQLLPPPPPATNIWVTGSQL